MSKKVTWRVFVVCFTIALLLVLMVHLFEWDTIVKDSQLLFLTETIMYLTGLAALYFGWRLIDHKFPSKREKQ